MLTQRLFSSVLIVLSLSVRALSQTATAELSGTVTDSTGGAVADAKVTATNPSTNFSREVRTNQGGAYVFTILTCIYLNDALHPGH